MVTRKAYDEADLNRAVQAYRFFYPTVSGAAIFKGNVKVGVIPNKVFGTLETQPKHVGFTLNSDTRYAPILLDLKDGPVVIELPPGPLLVAALDINQRWVAGMGVPGPAAGKGGKHLSPGYKEGSLRYYSAISTSYRVIVGARSLPVGGDVQGTIARIKAIKVHPLKPSPAGQNPDGCASPLCRKTRHRSPGKTTSNTGRNCKRLYARMMEVFAAYGADCDYHMGRIIDAVKQLPDADNTIFIYMAGDNGSSAEGGIEGAVNENLFFNGFPEKWQDNLKVIDKRGEPKHYTTSRRRGHGRWIRPFNGLSRLPATLAALATR